VGESAAEALMKRRYAQFAISHLVKCSMSKGELIQFVRDQAKALGMYELAETKSASSDYTVYYGPVMTYPHIMGMLRRKAFTEVIKTEVIKNVMIRAL
jgi:hypothetical protein